MVAVDQVEGKEQRSSHLGSYPFRLITLPLESCRIKRHKCTGERPSCARCIRSKTEVSSSSQLLVTSLSRKGSTRSPASLLARLFLFPLARQCLYPVGVKHTVFKPYHPSEDLSSPFASTSALQLSPHPPPAPPLSPSAFSALYMTPTSVLELAYPDPTERLLVRTSLDSLPLRADLT